MSSDRSRHSRQARFAPIGEAGQSRIREARAMLVGCGALGTHLAEFCVRAGVRSLTIVDRDFVEASNLQRQSLFTEADARAALPKAMAAAMRLREIDSSVEVRPMVADFDAETAEDLFEKVPGGPTLLLDATDNFEARFLLNDLAIERRIPWVYAACVGSRAAAMPIVPHQTACLRCLLGEPPAATGESCETTGIIMPAVLAAVAMASAEALKLMSGRGEAVMGRMRSIDVWSGESASVDAESPSSDCPACVGGERRWLNARDGGAAIKLCGRNAVQIRARRGEESDFGATCATLAKAWPVVARNEYLMRVAVSDGLELTLFTDGRALVSGTEDLAAARSCVARVLG